MKRLSRAIAEIDSYRASFHKPVWHSPTDLVIIGLLNTAITALHQVELLAPTTLRHRAMTVDVDKVGALIAQVNDELRDEADGGQK